VVILKINHYYLKLEAEDNAGSFKDSFGMPPYQREA
jgi:hypothetical protein